MVVEDQVAVLGVPVDAEGDEGGEEGEEEAAQGEEGHGQGGGGCSGRSPGHGLG